MKVQTVDSQTDGLGGSLVLRSGKCQRATKDPDAACKWAAWLLASWSVVSNLQCSLWAYQTLQLRSHCLE